jgi:hypothetical protein
MCKSENIIQAWTELSTVFNITSNKLLASKTLCHISIIRQTTSNGNKTSVIGYHCSTPKCLLTKKTYLLIGLMMQMWEPSLLSCVADSKLTKSELTHNLHWNNCLAIHLMLTLLKIKLLLSTVTTTQTLMLRCDVNSCSVTPSELINP